MSLLQVPSPSSGASHASDHRLPLISLVAIVLFVYVRHAVGETIPQDFQTYYYAAKTFFAHGNPYNLQEINTSQHVSLLLPFLYHPLFLLATGPLQLFSLPVAADLFFAAQFALLLYLLWLMREAFGMVTRAPLLVFLLLFGFNRALPTDFSVGNVALLEAALVWTAFACFRKGQGVRFVLLILVTGTLKILPLAFLPLVFLLPRDKRQGVHRAVAAFFVAWLLPFAYRPSLLGSYLRAPTRIVLEETGSINPCSYAVITDLLRSLGNPAIRNYSFVLWLVVIGAFFGLALPKLMSRTKTRELIFFSILTFVLLAPRFKNYSYLIVLPIAHDLIVANWVLVFIPFLSGFDILPGVNLYVGPYSSFLAVLIFWIYLLVRTLTRRESLPSAADAASTPGTGDGKPVEAQSAVWYVATRFTRLASTALQSRSVWIGIAMSLLGVALALSRAWICDDAYIGFRYADNFVRGLGLVFNKGEHVQAFANLPWNLYIAFGLWLGIAAEPWAILGGVLCFAGTVALLCVRSAKHARLAGAPFWLPLGIAVALGMPHLLDFATSGLETSAFMFLALAAYTVLVPTDGKPASPLRSVSGGAILAVLCQTPPEGLLVCLPLLASLFFMRQRKVCVVSGLTFTVLWLPLTAIVASYYGNFLPNNFFARSLSSSWWSQGLRYVGFFFGRYWYLLLGPLLVFGLLRRRPLDDSRRILRQTTMVEIALAAVSVTYVARCGGDFMFARLLIPVVPFLLLTLDRGISLLLARRPTIGAFVGVGLVFLALYGSERPLPTAHGIVDERAFYTTLMPKWGAEMDERGYILRRAFEGLDVRICFFGSEARMVYRSRVALAIPCETGTTDRFIARQPLVNRGRVGHEKAASLEYIIDQHPMHFLFKLSGGPEVLGLDGAVPDVHIRIGPVEGRMLTWDPIIVEALRARGVQIPDFPAEIDRTIGRLGNMSHEQAAVEWRRLKRFYFDHVNDPTRAAPFLDHVSSVPMAKP